MKTVGIIAEYNPFHNGHAYQLQKAKETANADFAVIIMSPDFVQRGEPALLDKYSRTRMALENGADLVLELPVCYATGSAEYFAEGGISLLHNLGCVDHLSFGCENDTPELFHSIADILLQEPEDYRQKLQDYLKKGETFPKARELALLDWMASEHSEQPEKLSAMLSYPNNILGLEYCKALKKVNSSISVLPVKRMGCGYHSLDLQQEFCSASAVRAKLSVKTFPEHPSDTAIADTLSELSCYLPDITHSILCEKITSGKLIFPETVSSLLHYKLLSEEQKGFEKYLDITPDLSDRIINLLPKFQSVESFVSLVKTKQLTEARIRRSLLHIFLNITKESTENYRSEGTVFYARTLGFRKTAGPLLHQIKECSSIPLITKLADAKKILSGSALQMLTQDIYASHIYQLAAMPAQTIRSEYTCSPIII